MGSNFPNSFPSSPVSPTAQSNIVSPLQGVFISASKKGVPPVFRVPLASLSGGYLSDISIDFSSKELEPFLEYVRIFEIGVLVVLALFLFWRLIRSFEV